MSDTPVRTDNADAVEENLRARLTRGDMLAETVQPILRHLLGHDAASIFNDEVLARVRSTAAHLAEQLLDPAMAHRTEALETALLDTPEVLAHLHALALEWQMTERLEQRFGVDPVAPPLLQALIVSPDEGTKNAGLKILASLAAWCQAQRRMQLPLAELPGDLLHAVLSIARSVAHEDELTARREARIRDDFDEGAGRLGLSSRLVCALGHDTGTALDLRHAGVTMFVTALALASGQDRDAVVLASHEAQLTRLALTMRAAGLEPGVLEQQMFMLHPDAVLPEGFDQLERDRAAAILSSARSDHG